MQYTLSPASVTDIDFLDFIHTENMKPYVEKLYPWKPQLFRSHFVADDYQVIYINNQIIGFLKVVSSETEIYLAEIQIAQDYQRLGIGSRLIHSLIEQAQVDHQQLWLKVLKTNPAQSLYQRLGFTTVDESCFHYIMRWFNSAFAVLPNNS